MALRFLDHGARYDPTVKKQAIETRPYATDWINMLGDILFRRCDVAQPILYEMHRKAERLAEALFENYSEAAEILRSETTQENPVWRLAEALTLLQGRKNAQNNMTSLLDSCLLLDRPNGLAVKRFITRSTVLRGTKARGEARCVTLSDGVLDYLVHLHVLRPGEKLNHRPLAFSQFVDLLRDRYGFFIDRAPAGMTVSNELLQANRSALERRLRDLGLLIGVNDAESMKHVQSRFQAQKDDNNHVD